MGIWKEIGVTFKTKSKKAFSLTPHERAKVNKLKPKIKSVKVNAPKKLKKIGSRIDFRRAF